jgi:hypothetical protein
MVPRTNARMGIGVQRLRTPQYRGSAMGVSIEETAYTSQYDSYDTVVISHVPSGRTFTVRMDRYVYQGRIRDRITGLEERHAHPLLPYHATWKAVDLDSPALAGWVEVSYENPEELIEACQDMIELMISGGAA